MIKIIGLTGKARSGKDTVAEILMDILPTGAFVYSLASPIKRMVAALLEEWEYDPHDKEGPVELFGVSLRAMWQELGSCARNKLGKDFWIMFLKQAVEDVEYLENEFGESSGTIYVIVPDVRYNNEAEFILEKGGVVIHVVKDDVMTIRDHESEGGVSTKLLSARVENNGSLEDLKEEVEKLLEEGVL